MRLKMHVAQGRSVFMVQSAAESDEDRGQTQTGTDVWIKFLRYAGEKMANKMELGSI